MPTKDQNNQLRMLSDKSATSAAFHSASPAMQDESDQQLSEADSELLATRPAILTTVRDVEKALHPLQAAADRVGNQVEIFAEKLDRLSREELEAGQSSKTCRRALPFIHAYKAIASDTAKRLRTLHRPSRQGKVLRLSHSGATKSKHSQTRGQELPSSNIDDPLATSLTDLHHWEQEEQIWDLLGRILQLDYPFNGAECEQIDALGTSRPQLSAGTHKYSAEKQIWDDFLARDDGAWERCTIIEWLQNIADRSEQTIESVVQEVETVADRGTGIVAHSWLYTREAIKGQKRLRSVPRAFEPTDPGLSKTLSSNQTGKALVAQLDPDAVSRQNGTLEPQDESFERAIWLACWEMLRRGKSWSYIQEWCDERVESWRAAVLWGSLNVSRTQRVDGGWFERYLWRKTCSVTARDGSLNEYEKAVYGYLGGFLPAVIPVCQNWHDSLLAHSNAYLLHTYELHTQRKFPEAFAEGSRSLGNFPTFAGQRLAEGTDLVEALKQNQRNATELQQPLQALQASIISRKFPDFVSQFGIGLTRHANLLTPSKILRPLITREDEGKTDIEFDFNDHAFLRLVTHIVLMYQDLGADFGNGLSQVATENVIVSYVNFLGQAGKQQLLPLYAARLSSERCSQCLARQLPFIQQTDERNTMMSLMEGYNVDVERVLYLQVQLSVQDLSHRHVIGHPKYLPLSIISKNFGDGGLQAVKGDLFCETISAEEVDIVHAFEWFLLYDGFWPQTMETGTSLYRFFLQIGSYAAGLHLAKAVPFARISLQKTFRILGTTVDLTICSSHENMRLPDMDADSPTIHELRDGQHQEVIESSEARTMLQQAQSLRDLEQLFLVLHDMKEWRVLASQIVKIDRTILTSDFRKINTPFKNVFRQLEQAIQPLLQDDWLQTSARNTTEEQDFRLIRHACLPELVIAYNSILNFSSYYVGREILKTSMELALLLARPGLEHEHGLTSLIMQSGRMPELMSSFAASAKSMIVADSKRPGEKHKDGRGLGLWTAKIAA